VGAFRQSVSLVMCPEGWDGDEGGGGVGCVCFRSHAHVCLCMCVCACVRASVRALAFGRKCISMDVDPKSCMWWFANLKAWNIWHMKHEHMCFCLRRTLTKLWWALLHTRFAWIPYISVWSVTLLVSYYQHCNLPRWGMGWSSPGRSSSTCIFFCALCAISMPAVLVQA